MQYSQVESFYNVIRADKTTVVQFLQYKKSFFSP